MTFLDRFKKEFELTDFEAMKFLLHSPKYYKRHQIYKRNGGKREIYQPTKSLKMVQRWVIKEYFQKIPVHDSATAYTKGKNIATNANVHATNRFLLKLDLEDFFYSIRENDLQLFFKENKVYENDEISQKFLMNVLLCKVKNKTGLRLSIGAPSSPMVSNAIMYLFDTKITEYCNQKEVKYTRYADDMFFSTNRKFVLGDIPERINYVLANLAFPSNLKLNNAKTVQTSKKFNRTVTGLTLSNDGTISVGRDKKRNLRMKAYNLSKKIENISSDSIPNELQEEINSLKGYIAFLNGVDSKFANDLKKISKIEDF